MELQYDENLVEAAVFLCSTGRRAGAPPQQVRRFHRERERLYARSDPDERNAAFFELHLEWFREWGLEQSFRTVIAEFPLLNQELRTLVFRSARSRNEEGAELYVNGAVRHAVVGLRSARFCDEGALGSFLWHEFTHLHDMLAPAFGYSPDIIDHIGSAAHQKLTRERYRLLWDITIDGRLAASGRVPMAHRERHWADFLRAYSFWEAPRQDAVFTSLWTNPSPCHAPLLELASDPRGLREACTPAPGSLCSLCGFPTFAWSAEKDLNPDVTATIQEQFPHWTPDQGVCARCFEVYGVLRSQQHSAAA